MHQVRWDYVSQGIDAQLIIVEYLLIVINKMHNIQKI